MFYIKQELPINGQIRAKEVQLISDTGEKLGMAGHVLNREKYGVEKLLEDFEKYGIKLDYTKMPRASREYVIAHTNELKEHDRLFFLRIIHSYIYNILKYPKSLFKERS